MKQYIAPIVGCAGILLISCSTPSVPPTKFEDGYCDIAQPILLLKSEIPKLSQETKRQIWAHNETWDRKCNSRRKVE